MAQSAQHRHGIEKYPVPPKPRCNRVFNVWHRWNNQSQKIILAIFSHDGFDMAPIENAPRGAFCFP